MWLTGRLIVILAAAHAFAPSPRTRHAVAPRAEPRNDGLVDDGPREADRVASKRGLLKFLDLNDDGVIDEKDVQVAAVSLAIGAASLAHPAPALAKGSGGHSSSHSSHSSSRSYRSGTRRRTSGVAGDYYGPGTGTVTLDADAATLTSGRATLRGAGTRFGEELRAGDVVTLGGDLQVKVLSCDARAQTAAVEVLRSADRLVAEQAAPSSFTVAPPPTSDGSPLELGLYLGLAAFRLAGRGEGAEADAKLERATAAAAGDFSQARERWELELARIRDEDATASARAPIGGEFVGVASDGETVRVRLRFDAGGTLSGRGEDSDGAYELEDGAWGASGALAWRETYDWGSVYVRGRIVERADERRVERVDIRFASSVGVHGHAVMKRADLNMQRAS